VVDLLVRDALGRVVLQERTTMRDQRVAIDVAAWAPGVYAIELGAEGKMLRGRVVRE
jgi:hypothetical protein